MEQIENYTFKTEPYQHQLDDFIKTKDELIHAIHWDPGLGKSKLGIDTAGYLFCNGKIDGVLIIAPNTVHSNWVRRELPVHMPDFVPYQCLIWNGKPNSKKAQKAFDDLLIYDHLSILSVNVEAFSSKSVMEYVTEFLKTRRSLIILDESSRIKNPTANRTKNLLKISKLARYKRTMTGTPVTKSPFDLYCQMGFLDRDIIGFSSYYIFTKYYGIWKKEKNWGSGQEYEVLVEYMNLPELRKDVAPYIAERRKDECLDLPEKVHKLFYVEQTPQQKQLYNEVGKKLFLEYDGSTISAQIVLVKLLRLVQINSGFMSDEEGNVVKISGENPKLEALRELLEEQTEGKAIIWSRFRGESDVIYELLQTIYPNQTVRFDGNTSREDREKAIDQFEDPESKIRFFLGSPQAGGIGITLNQAGYVYRLSNSYDLEERIQSDDRSHRIGQTKSVVYTDIVMPNTVDMVIQDVLKSKTNMAEYMSMKGLQKVVNPEWESF